MANATTEPNVERRLTKAVRIISVLDARRHQRQDPHLGSNIERMIVERELSEIEDEIYTNPGPLAPYLIPAMVHKKEAGRKQS